MSISAHVPISSWPTTARALTDTFEWETKLGLKLKMLRFDFCNAWSSAYNTEYNT